MIPCEDNEKTQETPHNTTLNAPCLPPIISNVPHKELFSPKMGTPT